jgi:exoribonuclease R
VFSVEPDAESGGWTLGVHISNAARYVEEGSTLDVLARRFGEFQRLEFQRLHDGNERHHVFMLPKVIRDAIDLSVNQPRETFSLMFSIDEDLKIRDGSQWLGLALVKSRASYSHGQLERNLDSDDPFSEFKLLEQFLHNYPNIFWAQGPIGKFMPAAALVRGMVDIFNSHVVNILKAKQIALPRHHNDRSAKLRHRLTGGGRTYTSLEAQRQLLAYLEKREAHSKAEVDAIVETIGVAPSESAAYKLFSCALAKWEMHREAKLRLCPDGVVEG